jgi:cellulose synthase/poly-beta-1,6-N-acetylglucosamine synthase-like glycosyltransferase
MNILLAAFVDGSLVLSILLTIQSAYTLYLMLYTWDRPEAYKRAKAPAEFFPPQKSFTVMLPARHEEDVIQTTIERVVRANYPKNLLEVVVICKTDDEGTISNERAGVLLLVQESSALSRQDWHDAARRQYSVLRQACARGSRRLGREQSD